ncbi:uncharacterized protein LOC125809977 [Solanum verrucosum]|uniref:uncharacterized protein LOC125809977 n=1 Tax=Solanum verrucosum TaxID=315347 RepID=UPI0020D1B491|nr:uncharacterized protein LOC125809977 [Solanum verrucosum]
MSFLGRLNYISRFIAQSIVICEPIFKLLKKDATTKWTEECQRAFDRIKEYLSNPPVLVPPEPGKPLLLYLFVMDNAFGCVLGQHDETGRREQAIYYLSKKFTPYEALPVCIHHVCDLKNGSTKKAIKGQALADHLAENPVYQDYKPLMTYFPDEEVHGDLIWVPPNEINVMGSPRPFAAWGMDVFGPIEPPASNRHRFIMVAIDYFTKWVEASTYKAVTKKVVADFVRNNIVCRFGIPESIITDNAANLNNDLLVKGSRFLIEIPRFTVHR